MLKALIVKELRESAGIIAVAVLVAAYLLAELTGTMLPLQTVAAPIHVDDDSLTSMFCLLAGGLAIALGFKQSAWELGKGAIHFCCTGRRDGGRSSA